MFDDLKKHIGFSKAFGSLCIAWLLMPIFSNSLCSPILPGELGYLDYFDSASRYCSFYSDIYYSFFSFGDNNLYQLFLYTTISYLIGLLIEILLVLSSYAKSKLDKSSDRLEYQSDNRDMPITDLVIANRGSLFVVLFISNWFVGGV